MAEGSYDRHLFERLVPSKCSGSVFWDVGTHFGYHLLSFAALAGQSGEVHGFEPNPANRERLALNLGRNPDLSSRVSMHAVAIADRPGEMNFVFSDQIEQGDSSCSYLAGVVPPREENYYSGFKRQTVAVETLDAFIEKPGIRPPNVLKIDVEGAEALVLNGARKVLQEHRPLILMEVHNIQVMVAVSRTLFECGYEVGLVDDPHASTSRCFVAAHAASRSTQPGS
jgi:FkbM family methyltransferase